MKYVFLIGILIFGIASFGFITDSHKAQSAPLKPFSSGDIYLHGEITDEMALSIGSAIKQLNDEDVSEITIHISSPGGSVYAGLQIYDYMHESKAKIRTSCEGFCMSMGAYLLSFGDIRQSSAHATIMYHQISTSAQGTIKGITEDLAEAQRLQDVVNDILKTRSGLSTNQINIIESHDNYMSPEQAKTLGLIDNIVGE